MAALGKVSLRLHTNADLTLATEYPAGDKPSASLVWDVSTLNLLGKTTGTPLSVNVRAMLSGVNAASAIITVETVSGDNAATEGFAISSAGAGNNLTHPGDNTGSGFIRLRATFSGQSSVSNSIAWSFAASGTDIQAPTEVTGFSVTAINGGVHIEHDASTDPNTGVSAVGVKDYQVKLNGSTVQTQTAGVFPGLSPTFQLYNLGTISSPTAPGSSQNAADWTIHAAGTGIHGTQSDQAAFLGAPVSGDFSLIVKVDSFSSSNQFSTVGLMVRENVLDGTGRMIAWYQQASTSLGLQGKRRAQPANNSSNIISVANIAGNYLKIERVGTTWLLSRSDDGGTWSAVTTNTDTVMGTSVYAGLFVASQTAGTEVTGVFHDLNLNTAPKMAYDVVSASGGNWTVVARDQSNNTSGASKTIAATPLGAPPATARILPRGHFAMYQNHYWNNPNTQTGLQSLANTLGGLNDWRGIAFTPHWRDMVGNGLVAGVTSHPDTDPNHYQPGFNMIDTILGWCTTNDLEFILTIGERGFGGDGSQQVIPQYLINEGEYIEAPSGQTYTGGLKCSVAIWRAKSRDYFIKLLTALANRYDNNPRFVMIGAGETALGIPNGVSDFSYAAFDTQLRRVFQDAKVVWKKTPLRLAANYYSSPAAFESLFNFINTVTTPGGVAIGGPDPELPAPLGSSVIGGNTVLSGRTITANEVFRGNLNGEYDSGHSGTEWKVGGGHDYRDEYYWVGEQQQLGFGGLQGYSEPPSDIQAYQQTTMKAKTMIWMMLGTTTNTSDQNAAGLRAYIESIDGAINSGTPSVGTWVNSKS